VTVSEAEGLGCLVPAWTWSAPVVAVHGHAVSLLHPDGALVSVVEGLVRAEARGIMLREGDFAGFLPWARAALESEGMAIRDGNALHVGDYAIRLSGIEPWDPRPELRLAREAIGKAIAARPRIVRDALEWMEDTATLRLPPGSVLRNGAFRDGFIALMKDAGGFPWNMAGFGPGTTPSGDDFITGFLLARGLTSGSGAEAVRMPSGCMSRTTAAGRSLLAGASDGVFPAHLVELGKAFAERCSGGDMEGLSGAVERTLSHGATSGSDALLGFLAGAERQRHGGA